jgi:hypothetical protein
LSLISCPGSLGASGTALAASINGFSSVLRSLLRGFRIYPIIRPNRKKVMMKAIKNRKKFSPVIGNIETLILVKGKQLKSVTISFKIIHSFTNYSLFIYANMPFLVTEAAV